MKTCYSWGFLFSHISYAEKADNFANTYWVFDSISKINVYGESNESNRLLLKEAHKNSVIKSTDDQIIIYQDLLENEIICNNRYFIEIKTPLNYFYSGETVDLCNHVLYKENKRFSEKIEVIKTGLNSSCPSPYEELIENNGYLIVINYFYFVFFREVARPYIEINSNPPDMDNVAVQSNLLAKELNTHCKNTSYSTFTDNYICQYPNKKIDDIYLNIVKIDKNNNQFLRKEIPNKNITDNINGSDVRVKYDWKSKTKLVVSLHFAGGVTTLIFEENGNTTTLIYRSESDS